MGTLLQWIIHRLVELSTSNRKMKMVGPSRISPAFIAIVCATVMINSSYATDVVQTALDYADNPNANENAASVLSHLPLPSHRLATVLKNGKATRQSEGDISKIKGLQMLYTDSADMVLKITKEEDKKAATIQQRRHNRRMKRKRKRNKKKNKTSRRKRFSIPDLPDGEPDLMWIDAVIPYMFDPTTEVKEERVILYLFRMFEYYTPLRFNHTDEIVPYLNFKQINKDCWSYVGRNVEFTQQAISSCAKYSELTAIHELGHAIGLYHEHQHKNARDNMEPNKRAIAEAMLPWFSAFKGEARYFSHDLDLDSIMGYGQNAFSMSSSNLNTLLLHKEDHKHIIGAAGEEPTMHYVYHEINNMFYPVSGCNFTCDKDGFPCLMNGSCVCDCPSGLDQKTNCSTILIEDPGSETAVWPRNIALIPTKDENCPDFFTIQGQITLEANGPVELDNEYNFDAVINSGTTGRSLVIDFCMRNETIDANEIALPAGAYCYIKHNQCQEGFTEGTKTLSNGGGFSSEGTVPTGIITEGTYTMITFCCRNDLHSSVPVIFPTSTPFILFPTSEQCQVVLGMQVASERLNFYNSNDQTDVDNQQFIPRMNANGPVVIDFCYYTPKTTDCGAILNLDSTTKQVTFQTPNYPNDYNVGQQCHWVIEGPPGTFLQLVFHDFDIATNPDGTTNDVLEIREHLIGNTGIRYSGEGFERNIVSHFNKMMLVLTSTKSRTAKGFNATVTVIDDAANCYTNKGENYDGFRNRTKNFRPCLPWKEAKGRNCSHDAFSIGAEFSGLDGNFCRFPGHGSTPWCFVDFNDGCHREDCDPCDLQGCYDYDNEPCNVDLNKIRWCNNFGAGCDATCNCQDGDTSCTYTDTRSDCASSISSEGMFCDTDEGKRYCAKTCGVCQQMANDGLSRTCSPPSVPDAVIIDEKSVYNLGEVAQIRCDASPLSRIHNVTCSSTGKWMPKLDSVCGLSECPNGFNRIGDKCFQVFNSKTLDEGKSLCNEQGGVVFTEKSDRSNLINAVIEYYSDSLNDFWLDLENTNGDDTFMWSGDEALTFTNWKQALLKLPYECRQYFQKNVFSKRSVTKSGYPCLQWDSEEVKVKMGNNAEYEFGDNYCRLFSNQESMLYCYYNASGTILKEDCDHLPDCYDELTAFFPRNFNGPSSSYTGHLPYADFGSKTCLPWSDFTGLTDAMFPDATVADAKNYCRDPTGEGFLWCYTTSGGSTKHCPDISSCSTDLKACMQYKPRYDGSDKVHFHGTHDYTNNPSPSHNNTCRPWAEITGYYAPWNYDYSYWAQDSLYQFDGSAADASNHCRLHHDKKPWCFDLQNPTAPFYWNHCDVPQCCAETGYTRASDFMGERSYSFKDNKCLRWDALTSKTFIDDDFPDETISDASNHCRDPLAEGYLYCFVDSNGVETKEWCNIPMDENTKDCAYYEQGSGRWVPTYCEDEHDLLCEIADDVIGTCVDLDHESCLELFTFDPTFCTEGSSTLMTDKCKHMCGNCAFEGNDGTCTEPTLNNNVIKVTEGNTVLVGHYFQYNCSEGMVVNGNLKRGCLQDGTLTGVNPSCKLAAEVNEWTFENNSMKERPYKKAVNRVYFSTSPSNTIAKDGFLKSWRYFTTIAGRLTLYVIRTVWDGYAWYGVQNMTTINDAPAYRNVELNLQPANQFEVKKGDFLGWMIESDEQQNGGIPYDLCNKDMFPEYLGYTHANNSKALCDPSIDSDCYSCSGYPNCPWGQMFWTNKGNEGCAIYSLAAEIGPQE